MPSVNLYQIGGGLVLFAVVVQAAALAVAYLLRLAGQRKQRRLSLELLEREVEAARRRARFVEATQFSWPGYRKFKVIKKQE